MALWDDATTPYTGQQPPSDPSSLWGWLTSLFQGRQPAAPSPAVPDATQVYTGPGVTPSLYPGSSPTGAWPTAAPPSLAYAPPSLYTAADPQQQARWDQASTPQGWAALAAQAAARAQPGGGGAVHPGFTPPLPQPKPQVPAPAGGSQGWAGVQGLPGTQSGIAVSPPPNLQAPVITGSGNVMPPAGGSQGWAGYPRQDTLTMATPPGSASANPPPPGRALSDAEIARMQPADIRKVLTRSDLTAGDNAALEARLRTMLWGM